VVSHWHEEYKVKVGRKWRGKPAGQQSKGLVEYENERGLKPLHSSPL